MIGIKRKIGVTCPLCSSIVEAFAINNDCSLEMCNNSKCAYPFTDFSAEELILETPNTTNKRYSSKSSSIASSSTVINSVALSTPVSDEMTIARPAKKARTGASQPVSGFSTIKQTDQLHSKLLSLNTNSVSNKKDVSTACSSVLSPTVTAVESNETTAKAASTAGLSVACTSVLSPTITAATSNQNTVQPTPTSDLVKQKKLLELLDIPVTAAFESSISSSNRLDSSTTSTAQASFDDILNTPLTLDTLSTPFMFDADLFINSESRNYATDSSTISSSSQNSPICQALSVGQISPSSTRHTSPSSSSDSAGNINDTCFSDISEVYSPPLSVELATSSQANNRKNITQTPPKKVSVSLPGNLALPPVSAAKTVSDTKNATYTMADINNLLNDNEIIEPTTVIANTSNNTTWIQDYDYLFP